MNGALACYFICNDLEFGAAVAFFGGIFVMLLALRVVLAIVDWMFVRWALGKGKGK